MFCTCRTLHRISVQSQENRSKAHTPCSALSKSEARMVRGRQSLLTAATLTHTGPNPVKHHIYGVWMESEPTYKRI